MSNTNNTAKSAKSTVAKKELPEGAVKTAINDVLYTSEKNPNLKISRFDANVMAVLRGIEGKSEEFHLHRYIKATLAVEFPELNGEAFNKVTESALRRMKHNGLVTEVEDTNEKRGWNMWHSSTIGNAFLDKTSASLIDSTEAMTIVDKAIAEAKAAKPGRGRKAGTKKVGADAPKTFDASEFASDEADADGSVEG